MVWLQERVQRGAGGDYDRIEELRATGPPIETNEFTKVIRAIARFEQTEIDLSTVSVPTLVVYGERDVGFVCRHARRFGSVLPDVTVREVPSAGHVSNLDAPPIFTDYLREFLETIYLQDPDGESDEQSGEA